MAAGISDRFTEATNGTRPVPTTLTALRSVGAGTISCGALTGWPTATAVHFIIYRTDSSGNKVAGSQTDWKGIVSGTTITGLVLKAGTDLGDSIGAIVEAAPTAAWASDMADGLLVEHKQTGAHAAVTADSLVATGNVQGATLISTGDIQRRSISTETIDSERLFDFIFSGGVWTGDSYGGSLNASMTALIYYINGRRFTISAVTARAFTASKDTYMDYDTSGVINYTEVANNAASPALSANRIRGGIIQSGATITAVGAVNLGEETKVLPIASSIPYTVTDSLGNLICPRDPNRRRLGYRQVITDVNTASASYVDLTGLSTVVNVPTGRQVKVSAMAGGVFNGANVGGAMNLYDGTAGAQITEGNGVSNSNNGAFSLAPQWVGTPPASGARNYKVQYHTVNGGTLHSNGGATLPVFLLVELI